MGITTSSITTLNSGTTGICTALLFTLLTYEGVAKQSSNDILKFGDDITVMGLICKNNESAYKEEVVQLAHWYRDINLSLNADKMKKKITDFRRICCDNLH